ncbi:hypothetical protein CIB48_g10969, partial [Xylaria polymorpha]
GRYPGLRGRPLPPARGNAASPPWNGRQIRNAFQIAPSIARYGRSHQQQQSSNGSNVTTPTTTTPTNGTQGDQEHYVGPEHFEKVEESTVESESGHLSPSLVPHSSPNRQQASSSSSTTTTTFQRRGLRGNTNRFSSETQRNRFSGEFHLRQRSSSSAVAPLYLPSATQQQQYYEDRAQQLSAGAAAAGGVALPHLKREPSPPWTPDLASVSDDASPR